MLLSMTGFGRAETTVQKYTVSVDVKSLNGKQFELNARLPLNLKSFEIQIKNTVQKILKRGSVEIFIALKQHGSTKPMVVNSELAKYYYTALQQIATELNQPPTDALSIVMSMPEVVGQATDDINEQDVATIIACVTAACNKLTEQRAAEGNNLQEQLLQNINNIATLSKQVEPYETDRAAKQKEKFIQQLNTIKDVSIDTNRLEQEIIYYLEKLDITEEKVRLAHHCNYFTEALQEDVDQKGKKIGFILQEVGREINTMGSKANDVNIQKIVVQMKDELEKAKEQALNIL